MNNEQNKQLNKQECFDAFIEEYKDNSLIDKQKIIISELKELIGLLQEMCSMYNFEPELLINREILDVNKENYSQDDFSEAIYTYIQMYKEILADFMLFKIKKDFPQNNTDEQ